MQNSNPFFLRISFFIIASSLALSLPSTEIRGQQILKNIGVDRSSIGSSFPSGLGKVGRVAFFFAEDLRGRGLWRSDGTKKGTYLLHLQPKFPPVGFRLQGLALKNRFYFMGFDTQAGWELFRSDGTVQGTFLLKDLDPRLDKSFKPLSGKPREFKVLGSKVFFVADGAKGSNLWVSDGTKAGTLPLYSTKGKVKNLTGYGNKLLFQDSGSKNTAGGLGLSDGTPKGSKLFVHPYKLKSGRDQSGFAVLGKLIFFSADDVINPRGNELFVSDGTAKGTQRLKDIVPGSASSDPKGFQAVGKKVFFSAYSLATGRELWATDGTTKGTVLIKDIEPKKGRFPWSSDPKGFVAFGNKLVFNAFTASKGFEPWISDGTASGTKILKDINPGSLHSRPRLFRSIGFFVFFVVQPKPNLLALYRTDGTQAGTLFLTTLETNPTRFKDQELIDFGGRALFQKTDTKTGTELWTSVGFAPTTLLFADILSRTYNTLSSYPNSFTPLGNQMFFSAQTQGAQDFLWSSDSSTAGTRKVRILNRRTSIRSAVDRILWIEQLVPWRVHSFNPKTKKTIEVLRTRKTFSPLYPIGDRLMFFEENTPQQEKIWITDGTIGGTKRFFSPSSPIQGRWGEPTPFGNKVVLVGPFAYKTGSKIPQVFVSDGTASGTKTVARLPVFTPVRHLSSIDSAQVGKTIFISLTLTLKAGNQHILFKTDGTLKGTTVLLNSSTRRAEDLAPLGNKLVFSYEDPAKGREIWISDGTSQGTVLLRDLWAGPQGSNPQSCASLGNRVFFSASTPATGRELFVTDGTPQGTKLFKDIHRGLWSGLTAFSPLVRVGSRRLVFIGEGKFSEKRIWVCDGTIVGTRAASLPLPAQQRVSFFSQTSLALGNLFFPWSDVKTGVEPWIWFPGGTARMHGFPCGTRPSLDASDPILGGKMILSGKLDPQQAAGVLLFGVTATTPIRMNNLCLLYLDPFQPMLNLPVLAIQGHWKGTLSLPNQPNLLGILLQSQILHPLRSGGFDLSNAVELALGQ
jgi:ELWxxDGT repeat protein